jgi:hypothetical protein
MRDDNYRHQRPPEPYRRPAENAGPGQGDPLAELARLIGQNDPFSDFARDQGRNAPPARDPRYADPSPADWQAQPPSYREAPQAPQAPRYTHDAHGDFRAAPDERRRYDEFGRDGSAADGHFAQPGAAQQDPRAPQQHDQSFAQQGFAQQDYAQPLQQDYAQPGRPPAGYNYDPQPQYDDARYAAYGHDQRGYAPQNSFGREQGPQGHSHDPYYRGMPHDEVMYEDQPRARRRGGMLTVMAVLALAVVGTAVAFGYRTLFSGSGAVATAPTIRADAGPNKIVPTTQASDPSGKLIYDRVGDKNQQERMVSREEQPVDMKTAAPPPRVVLSSGMANPAAPVPSSPIPPAPQAFPAPPAQAAAANASTEPKKVRTLTIRPDQPAGAPETTRSAPQPARTAAIEEQAPAPTTNPVRTTTIRQQAPQNDPNAPLSLAPGRQQQGATRTASAPASQPMPTSGGGAYAVQVTSQRTEAEAQSSYQALQAKYPNVLGNRQAMIRRADLGDKGTYYRAQVPFGTQGEASEFCASLKAAGGQCVVQRN